MRKLYQHRREVLNQEMTNVLNGELKRVTSDGGMHSVFLLPDHYTDVEICKLTDQQGLGIRALSNYYSSEQGIQGLVIGFAGYDDQSIKRGVSIIAEQMTR